MVDLIGYTYLILGVFNCFMLGHKVASQRLTPPQYSRDYWNADRITWHGISAVLFAPYVLAYELGRRLKHLPSIRISVTTQANTVNKAS